MPGTPDPTQTAAELILEQERAQAEVDRYKIAFTNLQKQKNQLQTTIDILTSANGLYAGVSDDLHFTINQFDTRLADLQNQINITNRRTPPPTWGPWLDMFLNVALGCSISPLKLQQLPRLLDAHEGLQESLTASCGEYAITPK